MEIVEHTPPATQSRETQGGFENGIHFTGLMGMVHRKTVKPLRGPEHAPWRLRFPTDARARRASFLQVSLTSWQDATPLESSDGDQSLESTCSCPFRAIHCSQWLNLGSRL